MTITSILSTASSGLASVNQQLALVSQNVANAGTPGYATEVAANTDLTAGGVGFGVTTGPATRETDAALESALGQQNATVAGQQVLSTALTNVDAAQGQTGAGTDLASYVGALQDAFTELDADPSNQSQQSAVVSAAQTLASGIQQQAASYATERQNAQDGLVNDVSTLNATIASIGSLSDQIVALQSRGESTADLESQRAAQEQNAAQLAGLQFLPAADGDVTVLAGGNVVDTHASSGPFSIATATLGSGSAGPPLLLSGQDVSTQITGGSIGAELQLRDSILPQSQAGLDEFAVTLATRFSNQGLTLFTDPAGNPPVTGGTPVQSGYVGFSNGITVNPAVVSSPSLVRDGTNTVAAGTGGAAGFTPNPAGGPAGFTSLITAVLQYTFGADAQAGTAQPAPNTTGLGAAGTISLPYGTGTTVEQFAANLAGAQSEAANAAQTNLSTSQALQNSLQSKLSSETGVSVDNELSNMVELQNAYGANAKIMTAVQAIWTDLFDAVEPSS